MLKLKDNSYVFDYEEHPTDGEFINFSFKKKKYNTNSPALRIYFKNDLKYNVRILKKLIELKESKINFCSNINNKKVRYIISNYYSNDVLKAFEALYINNEKERIEFLYNTIFDQLDEIWKNINPCGFCNNICEGIKHNQSPGNIDGCCYSFEYPKHTILSPHFTENLQKCKFFDKEKRRCSIKNLSCKFFVCSHVKKTTSFNIDMTDFLLVETFFSKKQKLILHYNYFRTQEEIIDKLLEKNNTPYFIYYWRSLYRIPPNEYNSISEKKYN